jgi:hypothetical protein
MTAGEFVVDEEHVPGMNVGDMPTEMTALSVYQVTDGKECGAYDPDCE